MGNIDSDNNSAISSMALRICQSLNLGQILNTTVAEVREFLKVDRIIIYRFNPDSRGTVIAESVSSDRWSIWGRVITDPCFQQSWAYSYQQNRTLAINDIYAAEIDACHVEFLSQFQVRANLVIPILLAGEINQSANQLWGLLIAHHCSSARSWQNSEIEFLKQLVSQVAIAIQQAKLFEKLQTEQPQSEPTEILLQQSQEHLHKLSEKTKDVIYRYRLAPKKELEYINPAIADLTGYTSGEFYSNPELFFKIVYAEDRDKVQQSLHQSPEITSLIILRWIHQDGRIIWIEQRNTPIHNRDGQLVAISGIARDISDRVSSTEATKINEDKLYKSVPTILSSFKSCLELPLWTGGILTGLIVLIIEAIHQAGGVPPLPFLWLISSIAIVANQSGLWAGLLSATIMSAYLFYNHLILSDNMLVSYLSPSLGMIAAFGVAALIGQTKEKNKALTKILQKAMEELETQVEKRTAALSKTNTLLRQEISDRQQALEGLRESDRRFREIFNQAFHFTWLLTTDGLVMEANQTALDFARIDLADILGQRFCQTSWWEKPGTKQQLNEAIARAANGECVRYEVEIKGTGNRRSILDFSLKPVKDETGKVIFLIPEGRDITERKQAEEKIQFQAKLLEAVEQAAIATDLDSKIVYWNHYAEILYGWSASEVLGRDIIEVIPAETTKKQAAEIIYSLQQGESWSGEFQVKRRDGTTFPAMVIDSPIFNEQGTLIGIIGISTDISDRKLAEAALQKAKSELEIKVAQRTAALSKANQQLKQELLERQQAEKALRESEERFRTMADSAPVLLWVSNTEALCTFFNQPWLEFTGRTLEEELGNGWIENIHPDDFQQCLDIYMTSFNGRQRFQREYRLRRYDGEYRWVLNTGIPRFNPDDSFAGYIGSCLDISQQKKAEATLRESERRWRCLLENVRLIVVGLDKQGKIEYVNPYFLELVGYSQAEVLGKDWFETFLPKYERAEVNQYFQNILSQDFSPHYQNSIITKSGEQRIIAWNNTLLQNVWGEAIATMSIGEDITERYAIERIKDEFISVVSHELRTPLTAINGSLNLLSTGLIEAQSERGKRAIQIAADSAERLVRLVNDILELERLESGKIRLQKQQVNAAELVYQAAEQMQVMASRSEVSLSIHKQSIELQADSDRLIQVLINLLSNAIKFSPPGSTVWLTVNLQQDGDIQFQVSDRGCGIPADKLETIFERFHQVDASDSRKKGGTGLGLAICRSIIEQHGGQIWAESTLGEGSRFYLRLPGAIIEENVDND